MEARGKSGNGHSEPVNLCARQLECFADVTRVVAHSGQMVTYPGHLLPGVFLVLAGSVRVRPASPSGPVADTGRGGARRGTFFPPLAELDQPAEAEVQVEEEAELLFVPRSLVHADAGVRRCLNDATLTAVSLR